MILVMFALARFDADSLRYCDSRVNITMEKEGGWSYYHRNINEDYMRKVILQHFQTQYRWMCFWITPRTTDRVNDTNQFILANGPIGDDTYNPSETDCSWTYNGYYHYENISDFECQYWWPEQYNKFDLDCYQDPMEMTRKICGTPWGY